MIIAHAPAGYLLYRVFPPSWQTRSILITTLIGAIAPDFDFAFNILGLSDLNHRFFLTHTPIFWIVLFGFTILTARLLKQNTRVIQAFFYATFLHIALDIPTGIRVWYPFSETVVNWFPKVYSTRLTAAEHLMHPYVIAEFVIWGIAIGLFVQRHLKKNQS